VSENVENVHETLNFKERETREKEEKLIEKYLQILFHLIKIQMEF
jgi:hypothetical protein